ncbi:helicase-exonuclease AddAB subunit AddB [Pelotomaculum terephthalicicum JT]|uniref:helicase-exonuclease AddAB subunit AddB n=1 Tax=Pelotomaculum terephthalicicum TaxID=206393 RepID=UPI0009D1EE62|nr:helicase-exonuclease AddAB subunit AddB [Pelotomaculum terephthalicicum]MCG9968053.1 helicase-exonuclease AddAB subunit AddB [Pelotomaculum terephthalicicum JT]OPY63978.1 MAG: ATP-dependent helicase/deoxyribonuclease subunit B [Pelotomaculum sp. PtaU1.Bin065]
MKTMTLRFIIGRAGVGKTRACLDAVRQELLAGPDGPPLILLVPEQATFQTEYALVSSAGVKGFIRAQVLSFRRLAYRVLLEVGGAARAHIGELGKRMALRRLLEQRRGNLKVFGRAAGQPGFADTLARTLGEMKTYCITPADLAAGLDALREQGVQSLLTDKLEDLCLLYGELEAYLAGRFTDPDDYLSLLAGRLEKAAAIKESEIWVDGFIGFTPQEYQVLAALLRSSRRINVTLCADLAAMSGSLDDNDLFYPSRETYDILCEIAARERVPVERPLTLEQKKNRFRNSSITYLEENFFRRPAPPAKNTGDGVVLAAAASRRAEVEGVAREIISLCRDQGYRYRDIVVLTRDLDAYDHLIAVVFDDHGIPVFVDRKRPVMSHPLIELVRAALEVVVKDWTYDPVFRYLKTDLIPLAREEVDLLENYVLAHGIRGSRWVDARPWEYRRRLTLEEDLEVSSTEVRELEEINRIRRTATAALAGFHRAVRQAGNVREITIALFNLLSELEVPEMLEGWSRRAETQGLLEVAREHSQVWDMLTALLDQVVETLGDEVLKPADYAAVLDAGFESMRLSLIPPGLDQVVAGSLDRSRSPQARASFIIGVNESVLPARITGQGVLSETERECLQAIGLPLSPGVRRKVFDEQYLVYIALTRSAERLILSYPSADDEGGANMPSPVIARVRELLPGVEERVWAVEPNAAGTEDLEFVTNPGRCLSYLAVQMREAKGGRSLNPIWWDVYNWFARGERREECTRALSGLFYNNKEDRLTPGAAKLLYGQPLKTSVSGIEKFRSCPFAHFLSQGLRLRDRPVFRLGAPDLGQFFHAALKLYGDRVQEMGLDWGELNQKDCRKLAGEVVDYLAPRLQNEILLNSARRRYLTRKIKRTVQRAALVLSEHAQRGKFRPVGLELSFGLEGELPAVTFILSDGSEMAVTGRIDRVDAARGDAGIYLRVIDYKSGRVTINLSDIFHGLKLQLLTYLEVALRQADRLAGGPGLPGAIFYFSLDDPLIKTSGEIPPDEELEKSILRKMRMEGMLLADPAVVGMMDSGLSGPSDLIPVQLKRDGDFAARSAVLTGQQFELLRAYLRMQLLSAGNDIISGVVDIAPYRQGNFRSCQHCLFSPVCSFDELVEGNAYRQIAPVRKDIIWGKLAEILGGEHVE